MNNTVQTSIRINKEIHEKLREIAFYTRKSHQEICVEAIKDWIKKNSYLIKEKA